MLSGSTVLNDTETAQYTHTLTVTGRLGGLYTCNVSNDKPSEAMSNLRVQGTSRIYQVRKYQMLVAYDYFGSRL